MRSAHQRLLLLAVAAAAHGAADAALIVPDWTKEMKSTSTQKCIHVPPTPQYNYSNNSRWAFTQLPDGTPPAAGWPVLIQLAIIPFAAEGEAPYTPNGTTPRCGMDGMMEPMFPWANANDDNNGKADDLNEDDDDEAAGFASSSPLKRRPQGQRSPPLSAQQQHARKLLEPLPLLAQPPGPPGPPPPPPNYWQCMSSMAQLVGESAFLRSPDMSTGQTDYCLEAVNATRYFPQPNGSGMYTVQYSTVQYSTVHYTSEGFGFSWCFFVRSLSWGLIAQICYERRY
jgi:hypothetical protein